MKTLVRPNRRAILAGCIPPLVVAVMLGSLAWWLGRSSLWIGVPLAVFSGLAGAFSLMILGQLLVPRIRLDADSIQLYLGGSNRPRLPLHAVECFFLGQGPSPIIDGEGTQAEARNLVVRLAERATEWHHREMKSSIGHWCDGYITLSGIWCEPISDGMVKALNHELATAKRASKVI